MLRLLGEDLALRGEAQSCLSAATVERGLRLLGDLAERGRIGNGQVGQDLPVELDPALRQPDTNWLYESPSARAAALMRMIQSRRIVRFLFFRSR